MAEQIEEMWAGDSLSLRVTVQDRNTGSVVSIAGATVSAVAECRGQKVTASSASITDGAGGVCVVDWAAGALSQGVWTIQVRVTDGASVDTVAEREVTVKRSLF